MSGNEAGLAGEASQLMLLFGTALRQTKKKK